MNRWRGGFLIFLIAVVSTAWVGCAVDGPKPAEVTKADMTGISSSGRVGTAIGDAAPDFQLAQPDGATVSLNDLRGQPAVLVFWSAWCPVCKEEAPRINELAKHYEPKGVRVLGINIRDSEARTRSGVEDFDIRYDVVRDADANVARVYKVIGTPTILFLDRNGIVRYFANELPQNFREALDELVAEKG